MAKKSNMARAGKAARKALNEKRRLEEDRKRRMCEAESGPLRICEVVPPCIKGLKTERLNDEIATIAELTGEEKSANYEPRLGLAINPNGFGKESLQWFINFWQKKLFSVQVQITELTKTEPADSEQLFEMELQKTRLQVAINYLEELIQLSDDWPGMPVLPQCRNWNYLYKGCPVMVFIPAHSDFLPSFHHQFVSGDITAVKHGKVTVRLLHDVRTGYHGVADFRQLTYRVDSMHIVRVEDFQRLLCDSYYRGGWLNLSAAYEKNPQLAADMKEAYELKQIDCQVGDYEFVAKIRSERKWKTPC